MDSTSLQNACDETARLAREALSWVGDPKNDVRVAFERPLISRALRNFAYQAKRLSASVTRPMCVGVFGPSQAGKSYLVSVLARKGESLIALFDDPARPEVDFIRDINPYGGKEATGLVTRFTIHKQQTPTNYPVALRLLSQTDLLKILANSYFFDTNLQEEKQLSPEDVESHLAKYRAMASTCYADVLREEDIWDVQEYFQRQIKRTEIRVFDKAWDSFAAIAPYVPVAARAELFSIFWGFHKPFTGLYCRLLENLAKLQFAGQAFCTLDALVPAVTGILNVETLAGLDTPDAEGVRLALSNGFTAELPKPIVTALTAELDITLKEAPWPFFEHTDLLDFPGYRSREQHNLEKYLREAKDALKELFLRGKVDYLFQRYTAEQELTSTLLCIPPSNLEVTTLAAVVEDWIGATHGRTPELRVGRPVLLFFCLTKFDDLLSETVVAEQADPSLRFKTRMEASLLKPFAKFADFLAQPLDAGRRFQELLLDPQPQLQGRGHHPI